MIEGVAAVDNRQHEIILKWQLFAEFGNLTPLHHGTFQSAYDYARALGYETTASVFDVESCFFLARFNVPFVKLACIPDLYDLADNSGFGYWNDPLVISVPDSETFTALRDEGREHLLCCIREYPADEGAYRDIFGEWLDYGISDHTEHGDFVYSNSPKIYERHFCLDGQTGPDTGEWALRPNDLRQVLEDIEARSGATYKSSHD